jgi:hypothetical protein
MQVEVNLWGMDWIGVGDFDDEFGQSGSSLDMDYIFAS